MQEFDFTKKDAEVMSVFKRLNDSGYFADIFKQYRDPATRYAFKVLTGRQMTNDEIKYAMFRHLQDLKRVDEDESFNYHYDLAAVHKILNFAKVCPDVNTNKPVPLMLWQQTILALNQGWRRNDDQKRFTRVLISVARTNGKTYLLNILMAYTYLLENDGLFNQDFTYAAPSDKQSKKGWRYLKQTFNLLGEQPGFKQLLRAYQVNEDLVKNLRTQSQILRMTALSGRFDSYHFNTAVMDESGDKDVTSDVLSKITSGQVQTPNHQFIQISTAYENPTVQLHKDEIRLAKVLRRDDNRTEDNYLVLLWSQDAIKEIDDPTTWVKSNPLLDLPDKHETLLSGLIDERDSKLEDGTIADFQNRNLNMWLQTDADHYLESSDIQKSVIKEFDIRGRDVYVGFDLSHMSDDTSFGFVFPYVSDDGKNMFHLLQHAFVPLARAQNSIAIKIKQDGINYLDAQEKGFATVTHDVQGLINEDEIGDWFMDFVTANNLRIKAFVYDPYQTSPFIDWLDRNMPSVPFITLRQGTLSLNQPTIFLRKQFIGGNITILNDEVLTTALTNAVTTSNEYGIKIDKRTHTQKIDAADAIIDAMSEAAFYHEDPTHSVQPDNKNPFVGMDPDQVNDYFTDDFSF